MKKKNKIHTLSNWKIFDSCQLKLVTFSKMIKIKKDKVKTLLVTHSKMRQIHSK
jgi:hypothetical protein